MANETAEKLATQLGNDIVLEWMVTRALESSLAATGTAWLFGLEAQTKYSSGTVESLCGFGPDDCEGGVEKMLRLADRGKISAEDFTRLYKDRTPDCSFWTNNRERQLFIEFKGTPAPNGRDEAQARRYLDFFRAHPSEGAVLYAVPRSSGWQQWLQQQAVASSMTDFPIGTIEWDAILPHIKNELLRVIEKEQSKLSQIHSFVLRLRGRRP